MALFVEWALRYASKGMDVFPLQARNKIPMKDFSWHLMATTDEAKIREWWRQWPNANIGIATGKRSGVIVLDVDAGHGGEESLDILTDLNGALPETPQTITGGGGRHIFFAHPGFEIRNSASKLGMGLDIRGDGGYIVAPPSIHPTGKLYEINEEYPRIPNYAPLPKWIISILLRNVETQPQHAEPIESQGPANKIMAGGRNAALTSLAGTMRKRGMSGEALLAAMIAENNVRCFPPLDEHEVKAIVESVERYDVPTATPRGKRVEAEWLLCAAAYQAPEVAMQDAGYIGAYQFTDVTLERFWYGLMSGTMDKVQAATEAGIIRELTALGPRVNIWDMANYASQMTRHEYLDILTYRMADLSRHIESEDTTGAQKVVTEMADMMPGTGREPETTTNAIISFKMVLENMAGRSIHTGIRRLDHATGGFERQTLTVLAARPSVGKSTLALQIAKNVAGISGKALFFSLEMATTQLIAKMACGELQLEWKNVRETLAGNDADGELNRSLLRKKLLDKADELARRYGDNLLIDDGSSTTDVIWQTVARYKPDLVVVDHLGKVSDEHPSEVKRLGIITGRLKQIAKKYNTAVLLLCQLNRAVEVRDNKRPQLPDLRDSGEIEQDADNVIMMYRPEYYEDKAPARYSETELWIRKFRDGVRNEMVKVSFDTEYQAFVDPSDIERK